MSFRGFVLLVLSFFAGWIMLDRGMCNLMVSVGRCLMEVDLLSLLGSHWMSLGCLAGCNLCHSPPLLRY